MKIEKAKRIEEVQAEFNNEFPGLKLNFVKYQHDVEEGSPKDSIYSEHLTLEQIQPNVHDGYVDLPPTKKVQDLELELENRFGLHTQVYRRSKDTWLQTTATDDWTLEDQNNAALRTINKNYGI